jgi:Leucine-rich repeat (LRR) protein
MDTLNDDCILYMTTFLSFQDKMSFIQTCKKFYIISQHIFKHDIIEYNKRMNYNWLKMYKPKIQLLKNFKVLPPLECVHEIQLHNNLYKSINFSAIGNMNNLQELTITRSHLKFIPKEISDLPNLTHLSMHSNIIKDFKVVCNLPKLTFLNLSYNHIQKIPDEIDNLTNLKTLKLGFNSINTISSNISNLTNLQYIELFANHITSIPQIETPTLYLDFNNLNCICNCLSPKLQILDISNNPNLACVLPNLIYLKTLCISDTNIDTRNVPNTCIIST